MSMHAKDLIAVALGEVGYLEKKNGNLVYLYDKTSNAGSANYTKYGKEMHDIYPAVMDYPAAWCDAFVDWCFQKAFGISNAKGLLGGSFNDYTVASAQLYKNKGAYFKKNPRVGDQIFFKNSSRICHTGIVYAVDATKVYTIEGNTSGASGVVANGGGVCKKSYSLGYYKIDGYGRPNYTVEVPVNSPAVTDQKAVNKAVQSWMNQFLGTAITEDGAIGTVSKAHANKCLQKALGVSQTGKITTANLKLITYPKVYTSTTLTKVLEMYLFLRGYNPMDFSGKYNADVENAVAKFQSDMGLEVDKQAGPASFKKLVF